MSQENVEIVRSFYDQWTRDDSPPIELMDPEIEYVNPAGAVEPGTRHGLDAFTKAVEKVFEGWEAWQMKPEQFESVGDQVAVVVRYRARGRGSGVEVEGRESALWTLRDGKVVRYAWFHEPGDALEALGPFPPSYDGRLRE
jgi:ketosteroid isomerase-like protein